MTDGTHRRLRRTLVLCASALTLGAALPGAASAAEPGLWIGSTYMKATRTTRWVGASDTSRGDFWFRVDSHGNLHGFAVVADEPTFDAERLNNLINYLKSYVGATVGLLPLPGAGAAGGIALADIVGVKISRTKPMAVRSGPITGHLGAGGLTIDWARKPRSGLSYEAVLGFVDHDQHLTSGTISAPEPWPGHAHLDSEAGSLLAIATYQHTGTTKEGRVDSTSVYWTAHRVSG